MISQFRWAAISAFCVAALGLAAPAAEAVPPPLPENGTCVETDGQFHPPRVVSELEGGGQRIEFRCGPIDVTPGQNRIEWPTMLEGAHRPSEDGWITRLKPDLVDCSSGTCAPLRSDEVMFHHAVWLNETRRDASAPKEIRGLFPQRFFGAGEEKTTLELPEGYGYRYEASDRWTLNHMLHSLVDRSYELYIQYTVDFFPHDSEASPGMTEAEPLWLDVQNGSAYPVFDVWRGQGKGGRFTYPDDAAPDPYENSLYQDRLNRWTVDRHGYLLWTAGHVHSGGLWTDLDLIRNGAEYRGPDCGPKARQVGKLRGKMAKLKRNIAQAKRDGASGVEINQLNRRLAKLKAAKVRAAQSLRGCRTARPRVNGNRVELFRSNAKYFDRPGRKAKPTSWDMAMYNTTPDWRPQLRPGDRLELTTTYETRLGSWYESMGINFLFMARCNPEEGESCGENPYRTRQDNRKRLNHGPLPENNYHGGKVVPGAPDPGKLPANEVDLDQPLLVGNWAGDGSWGYQASDFFRQEVVAIRQGERPTFELADSDKDEEIWHSITSCKAPCNRSTGISYPIPDGRFRFDSGQLSTFRGSPGASPTRPTNGGVGRESWDTLDTEKMDPDTYTFFCRIHPSMRGALRILPKK